MSTRVSVGPEKLECFVSVASSLCDGEKGIETFVARLHEQLKAAFSDYEILLVHQGVDRRVAQEVSGLLSSIPCVRFIELQPGFEEDVCVDACVENAIGDFVVLLDPRSDPVESIRELVDECRRGSDVVIGVAPQEETWLYRLMAPWMRRALRGVGYDLPRNATDLRCLSRRAVNSVTRVGRPHHQLFAQIARSGFPMSTFPYHVEQDPQQKKRALEGLRKTMRVLVFNSTKPLRWMIGIGLLGSLLAALAAAYSLIIHLFKNDVMEGWTSTVLFVSVLFALQFSILAFFGEYLGRLLDESSRREAYSVVFEQHSSVMSDDERKNVKTEALGENLHGVDPGSESND